MLVDNRLRILLSVDQGMWKELLEFSFDNRTDLQLVGETDDAIECLALIVQSKPDVWIHSLPEGLEMNVLQSRAFDLSPDLTIVRVDPRNPVGQLQVQVRSISDIVSHAICKTQQPENSLSV